MQTGMSTVRLLHELRGLLLTACVLGEVAILLQFFLEARRSLILKSFLDSNLDLNLLKANKFQESSCESII